MSTRKRWHKSFRGLKALPIKNILANGIAIMETRDKSKYILTLGDHPVLVFPNTYLENGTMEKYDVLDNDHFRDIGRFFRRYLDCPRDQLFDIQDDYMGMRDVLLACDRRIGKMNLSVLLFRTNSDIARMIVLYRLGTKNEKT